MEQPAWARIEGVDLERPNAARMYDYYLGGSHNFAVDRELAERTKEVTPQIERGARELRGFLVRAVRHLAAQGIDQFLDIGSGIPTVSSVHASARAVAPGARVAYVDNEAVAVAHSRAILADIPGVSVTAGDLRDPASILDAPAVTDLLDLTRPVAVLMLAVLHFVPPQARPDELLARYRAALAPGSALVISHASDDYADPELAATVRAAADVYRDSAQPLVVRSRAGIAGLFDGFDVVEPGLVDVTAWRRDRPATAEVGAYGGVGLLS